jgi:hypothetical protein
MRFFTKTRGDTPRLAPWTAADAIFAAIGGVGVTRWLVFSGEPSSTWLTLGTFALSAVVLFAILRLLPDALWRCIGYGLVASAAASLEFAAQHAPARVEAVHAAPMAEAPSRPRVISADDENRLELVEELEALATKVARKWRLDVANAKAHGPLGQLPPMLAMTLLRDGEVELTNKGAVNVCVNAARVELNKAGQIFGRCWLAARHCQVIPAGETRRLKTYLPTTPTACAARQVEFRVGSMLDPEPSWWTDTALQEFDAQPPGTGRFLDNMPIEMLKAERAYLLGLMGTDDRDARWLRELDAQR